MGDAEIAILSWMYDVCIVVYHPDARSEFDRWSLISPSGNDDETIECMDPTKMIYLYNSSNIHYDLLTDLKFKEDGEITSEDEEEEEDDDATDEEKDHSDQQEDDATDYSVQNNSMYDGHSVQNNSMYDGHSVQNNSMYGDDLLLDDMYNNKWASI